MQIIKNNFFKLRNEIKELTKVDPKYHYFLDYFDFHTNRYNDMLGIFYENDGRGAKLLDVGASPYHFSIILKENGYQVEAINIEYGNYEKIIETNYGIKIIKADLSNKVLPFSDNYFDFILFSEVMEHLSFNMEKLLKEFYRILKPGGKLIITTPNLVRLNNRIKILLGISINWNITEAFFPDVHVREYTKKELIYLLEKAGFKSYNIFYQNFDYPNIPYFVKLIGRFIGLFIPTAKSNIIAITEKKV